MFISHCFFFFFFLGGGGGGGVLCLSCMSLCPLKCCNHLALEEKAKTSSTNASVRGPRMFASLNSLLLSIRCLVTVNVLWPFLMVPCVGLQCGIS